MNLRKFWKEAKHVLAFVLAVTLFFNGWTNYDFSVLAADELTVTLDEDEAEYTGEDLTPNITVTDSDGKPVMEYSTVWNNANGEEVNEIKDAGEYTVTVTNTKTESGNSIERQGTGSFTVNSKGLTDEMVYIDPENDVVNGQDHSDDITVTVTDGDTDLSENTDYTVTKPNEIKNVGSYEIVVQGKGNYTGEITKTYTLEYATAEGNVILEGSSLEEPFYAGDVTVKPAAENYEISKDREDSFSVEVIYEETPDNYIVYLKEKEKDIIIEVKLPEFTIDNKAPELELTPPEDEWASSKVIEVKSTDADYIYYSTEEVEVDNTITAIPFDELTEFKEENLTIAENISQEQTYYFYAIDKAGNVTKAETTVNKIDIDLPEVSIGEGLDNFDGNVYWKDANELAIPVTLRDEVSGIQKIEVTGGLDAPTFEEEATEVNGTLTITSADAYTLTVTDLAGNNRSVDFIVKQDTVAPEVTLQQPEGENRYQDANNVYWFSAAEVSIPLNVEDSVGTDEETSAYEVVYSKSEDMSDSEKVDNIENDEGKAIILLDDNPGTPVTYYFQAIDKAGNKGEVQNVQIAYDNSEPEIVGAELTQLGTDEWINKEEFNGDSYVAFSVTAKDEETEIKTIEYSSDGINYQRADFSEEDGVYTFATNETYADGEDYQWSVRVTNNVNQSKVQKLSGGKIDVTAPDKNAYIKFLSDTEGANDTNRGTVKNGKWTSNIYEIATDAWNKIWGRNEVEFEIYVQDVTSGIDSISMSYNGTSVSVSKEEGLKAIIEGTADTDDAKNNEEGYTVFKGTITYTGDNGLAIQNFQIDSITDVAGNGVNDKIVLGTAENTDIIYIDAVEPKLSSVTIGDIDVRSAERYFYNTEQSITLTINERFFAEENTPVYPTVTLYSRESADAQFEPTVKSTKEWTQGSDYNWSATLELPLETGKEMEYKLVMEKYADPSGNLLTGTGVKDGVFESKIFVIDAIAPKLVNYSVNAPTDCNVNGVSVYKNDTANPDLTVEFEIDDNVTYYDISKENLEVKVYRDAETTPVLELTEKSTELNKTFDGRSHKYSFTFDAEATSENEYHVEIAYKDAADNNLTDEEQKCTNGLYKSENYIIDHVAPVFDITYSDATRIVKDGVDGNGMKPLSEHTAYYNNDIEVTYTFNEKYANTVSATSLEHYKLVIKKDGNVLTDTDVPEVSWTSSGTVHTATFKIEADKTNHTTDGNYQFTIKYRDCAENIMVTNNESAKALLADGMYTSPILVMDTTAPVVNTSYSGDANQIQYGRDYFNDLNTVFKLEVVDRNIRYKELKDVLSGMKAYDINPKEIEGSTLEKEIDAIVETNVQCVEGSVNAKENSWKLNLSLQTEANYDIPVNFVDLAGNKAIVNGVAGGYTEFATVDATVPEFELTYSITDPVNYLKWGYLFAKSQMNIKVTAKDEIAGIHWIKFTIVDENGKETVKPQSFSPKASCEFTVDIPLSTRDFKGSVLAEILDYSTNETERKRGHIVESTEKHSSTGKAVITTITKPSRTVNGVDFYNTDVKFKLTMEDTYSGISSWEYVGGKTLKKAYSYRNTAGTDLTKDPNTNITYSYVEELTLDSAANNFNDTLVTASYIDNAGYTNKIEQKYNIDITKPEITVVYDLNEPANEKYYKETRTATVNIKERNFDPSDVEFLITSTDGPKPEISGWSKSGSGDETINSCTVEFSQDSDYTFTLKFMDMAGNVADYNRVDEFTIDKTIPVATITYDNNSFLNEYYYDASRTATIDILEHNFDPTAIEIMVTADGSTTGVPHISSWAHNGDHNIATITFSADAEYTFDIAGMDLALNEMEDYTPDHFVVDQTAPELEIFDIEHMSANNGIVRPGIRYHDTNYDKDGTVILMTGYHNGVVEMTGDRKLEANGLELKLDDFAYVQSMDDIYTMEASVYDLAGNSSEAMVMFSVNRFGSVYTFDEATDALIGDNGKYYTNKEQQLVITETNVDTLEFKEITMNLNGKLTTLKEGVDYAVALQGTDATWKQYTYTLKADNFVEEGTYILTIYSEDRATNTSDNNTKGKKVEFVVDKTNPSALISGVEDGGQYRTSNKEMTIDVEDNVRLAQVVVTIDGVETVYDAAQINEVNGKLVLNIGSANHWQDVKVEVTDSAGNKEVSEEMRVLVTANIFVQFFMNKPVFYGTLGGGAVLAALLWWFLVGKKKKEKEQAK